MQNLLAREHLTRLGEQESQHFELQLGENDFLGLQGKYLTNIPTDPWDKNYKLDPMGCFIYSEGPDSNTEDDDIRDYYVKDLALVSVEWADMNNDRVINKKDKLYFTFNKPLHITGYSMDDFDIFENGIPVDTTKAKLDFTFVQPSVPTTLNNATSSVFIAEVGENSTIKLGVHSIAIKEGTTDSTPRTKYQEVWVDREETTRNFTSAKRVYTKVPTSDGSAPLRYIMKTNPIKIKEKK